MHVKRRRREGFEPSHSYETGFWVRRRFG